MIDHLRNVLKDRLSKLGQRGASAVEYGLLIAGIAAVVVVAVVALGPVVKNAFTTTCDKINTGTTAVANNNCGKTP
jgi:pilus assembly protein Flp/PilA